MVTLEEKIKNISKIKVAKLNYDLETTKTIDEFWQKVVKPHIPDVKIMLKWYDLIKRYVEEEDAVFVIRTGNSRKNGDDKTLRRGFYSKIRGSKKSFLYTDNDYAVYIYSMAYDGYCPTLEEFKDMMLNRKFPVHFNRCCKVEKDRCAFPINGSSPLIGKNGYKLSHISDAGMAYEINGSVKGLTEISNTFFEFDKSEYDDWKKCSHGYFVRECSAIPKEAEDFLKAHFLRLACPLNYILTPKKSMHYTIPKVHKKDIGEFSLFLSYVEEKLHEMFYVEYNGVKKDWYQEYLDLLMLPAKAASKTSKHYKIEVRYGMILASSKLPKAPPKGKTLKAVTPVASTGKISKNGAKALFESRGYIFDAPVTFASKNKTTGNYWANPKVTDVNKKWYLILNDEDSRVLHLFLIDTNDIKTGSKAQADMSSLIPRADNLAKIELHIYGDDTVNFADKISSVAFAPYLIDKLNY